MIKTLRFIKYADNTALVRLLQKTAFSSEVSYYSYIKALEIWCLESKLEMIVSKLNKQVDSTKQELAKDPVQVYGQVV